MRDSLADASEELGEDAVAPPAKGDPYRFQRQRAAAMGGFCLELDHHVLTWLPGNGEHLVVSFDNLAALREQEDRDAWGQKFLLPQGIDVLGVQIKRRDWFRDQALIDTLVALRDDGLFRRYDRVSMYGSSMGGFAALAFAPLAPGCTVMAFAPQRSLDQRLCPFEKRYRYAIATTDWSLAFGDAAEGLQAARRAYIAFDPKVPEDNLHAASLVGPNVTRLEMPWLGHKLPPALLKMRILKQLSMAAFDGQLELGRFHKMMRARHGSMPWKLDLLQRARARGHVGLALRLAERLMADGPHWKLRHLRNELRDALRAASGGDI